MADTQNTLRKPVEVSSTGVTVAKIGGAVATVVLIVALAVGAYAVARIDTWGERNAAVPQRFQLELDEQVNIPPALIGYAERLHFDTTMQKPHALAVAADGSIFVAGDRAVLRFHPDGQLLGTITMEQAPTCLAVQDGPQGTPERVYVGSGRHVSVFRATGEPINQWPDLGDKSVITAIAVAPQHVFVADAGQRIVLSFDPEGREIGRMGAADPDRKMPGFIIPSAHFDLVAGPDEVLWVVNPGMRRIESYSFSGELQGMWGRAARDSAISLAAAIRPIWRSCRTDDSSRRKRVCLASKCTPTPVSSSGLSPDRVNWG